MLTSEEAMKRLEKLQPNFKYSEAKIYAALIRKFYAQMKLHLEEAGLQTETPLVDSVKLNGIVLPSDLQERIDTLVSRFDDYGTTVKDICCWYIREALANDRGVITRIHSVYEPLIELLEMGGHFYEHHGALVLSDAATIPFVGR